MLNASIYDLIYEKEHQDIHNLLSRPATVIDPLKSDLTIGNLRTCIKHFIDLHFYLDSRAFDNIYCIISFVLFLFVCFEENQVNFVCHMKKGGLEYRDEETFESVQFIGYFRK